VHYTLEGHIMSGPGWMFQMDFLTGPVHSQRSCKVAEIRNLNFRVQFGRVGIPTLTLFKLLAPESCAVGRGHTDTWAPGSIRETPTLPRILGSLADNRFGNFQIIWDGWSTGLWPRSRRAQDNYFQNWRGFSPPSRVREHQGE